MSGLAITVPIGIALLVILWLVLRPRKTSSGRTAIDASHFAPGAVLPMHYRYFSQIRQALSEADDKYLEEAAPSHVARQARRERRAVARRYLRGLQEDFSNLERLGRMIAAMSPVISRDQEAERLSLYLKFHAVWSLVWLSLWTGRVPMIQVQYLTGLVGRLAIRMDQAMSEINALSADRLSGKVSA